MREAKIERKTAETDIKLYINLDGTGKSTINTGCGFLDHMLTLFAKHGSFDLDVSCVGDVNVDFHHTVEDIGIALGEAIKSSLGDKAGICRYGDIILPMDEALILSAIDLSGRSYLGLDLKLKAKRVGNFDTELVEEFFTAFVSNAKLNLHVRQLAGRNTHHIIEGAFKAVARALSRAVKIDDAKIGVIPSTKGVL